MSGIPAKALDEDVVRLAARNAGPDTAFGRILADLDRRRAKGEDVVLLAAMDQFFVAPRNAFDGRTLHFEGET